MSSTAPGVSWYVPAGHCCGRVAPDPQKKPIGHTLHSVEEGMSVYVPGGHAVGVTAPCKQKLPGGQAVQLSIDTDPLC